MAPKHKVLVGVAACFVVLLTGALLRARWRRENALEQARKETERAEKLFDAGDCAVEDLVKAYESFLKRYPTGFHARCVRDRMHWKMRQIDDKAWRARPGFAFDKENCERHIAAYETYLKRFPEGYHAWEAKREIARLLLHMKYSPIVAKYHRENADSSTIWSSPEVRPSSPCVVGGFLAYRFRTDADPPSDNWELENVQAEGLSPSSEGSTGALIWIRTKREIVGRYTSGGEAIIRTDCYDVLSLDGHLIARKVFSGERPPSTVTSYTGLGAGFASVPDPERISDWLRSLCRK